MKPGVSVVIPTYNRPDCIRRCLDALSRQTLWSGTFEVIVVDDGSPRPLELDPAEWAYAFPLCVIRQDNSGPAGARNRGAEAARGKILAFTDDDCLPTPGWLENIIAPLSEQPEALIGGNTFNGLEDDLWAEASQLIITMAYDHFNVDPARARFFTSNNVSCCRDIYQASGGFDVDFVVASEDREFCDRWRMLRRPLLWVQDARLEHRHAQTICKFIHLHFRYGQGAYLYQAKRQERNSGTMGENLAFHRTLFWRVSRKLSTYSMSVRLTITVMIIIWQIANAAGFFWQAVIGVVGGSRQRCGSAA